MYISVKRATACLVLAMTLGLTACGQSEDFALKEYAPKSASSSIKAVSLGTSDSNSFDAKRVATQFPAGTKKVLVWYRWEGADKDSKVAIHWSMGNVSALQQGEAFGKESGTAAWVLEMGAGGDLPAAGYKVELLENGTIVTTIPFQVGAGGAAAPVALAQAQSEVDTVAEATLPAPADTPVAAAEPSAPLAPAVVPGAAAVLASADGERSGVRVEVTELKRSSGDTVNLKFVLINDSDAKFDFWGHYLGNDAIRTDYKGVGGVHLVDPVGKKKYLVVRDAEQKCMCSTEVADAAPKTRVNLWAKFPAPPADVQMVSIVIPHFSPMDDVSISQ